MADLTGKVALVTGASRGIGAAIAELLGASGASVAVNYAGSADAAENIVRRIRENGSRAISVQADVSDPEACTGLIEATLRELGGLDILVNNAGITRDGLLVRMSDEDWESVIGTNLTGVFNVTRAATRHLMKQRSGAVVNVTSVIGLIGNAGQANYAAAKAGVIGLTKSVAKELASRGVRVNAVAPGFIETDMTAALSETAREAIIKQISLARLGAPADVAKAVAFLASDEAAYITGQTLAIDGGMTFM
ncbi:MAG: 3-oxoacyl-[acyl-carrier-protein] reductase [Coriobacteriia bacterium]|nr:3-oxoacyl-[acyl-carrier-protein] reductase [Coriobacteriia bacterium]